MYFFFIVIILFLFSLFLAFRSLKQLTRDVEVGSVKQELKKGKVVFQNDQATQKRDL